MFHQYTIRVEGGERDAFAAESTKRGVGNGVYYPTPIHRLPSFNLSSTCPTPNRPPRQVLSLPVYPSLTEQDLETIAHAVNDIAKAGA